MMEHCMEIGVIGVYTQIVATTIIETAPRKFLAGHISVCQLARRSNHEGKRSQDLCDTEYFNCYLAADNDL